MKQSIKEYCICNRRKVKENYQNNQEYSLKKNTKNMFLQKMVKKSENIKNIKF